VATWAGFILRKVPFEHHRLFLLRHAFLKLIQDKMSSVTFFSARSRHSAKRVHPDSSPQRN